MSSLPCRGAWLPPGQAFPYLPLRGGGFPFFGSPGPISAQDSYSSRRSFRWHRSRFPQCAAHRRFGSLGMPRLIGFLVGGVSPDRKSVV